MKHKDSCFSGIFKRCKQCTNRFIPNESLNRLVFCSNACRDKWLRFERERQDRFQREADNYYQKKAEPREFEGICDICYGPVFSDECTPMPRIAHLKCGPPPKSINTEKLRLVEELILRGATEGERSAAKAAYKRITGRDYK